MSVTTMVHPQLQEARAQVAETVAYLRERVQLAPRLGLILGSGLGPLAHEVEHPVSIPYGEIPHFCTSTAPGHAGNLVFGTLAGQPVVCMQGRFHLYEGYTAQQITYPVRVMRAMGAETLIVSCAAGGLNAGFKAGELMLLSDHINLTATNPLIGPNDPEWGPRFPVMFDAYKAELRAKAHGVAKQQGITLHEGVYAGIAGPSFFTPAELQHLITIGSDAIGMSMVSEAIVAVHSGMKVLGFALISDMARPDRNDHATEQEILATVAASAETARNLVRGVVATL